MPDPLAVLAELTRLGRALAGSLQRQTVCEHTAECLQRLFEPEAVAVALAHAGRHDGMTVAVALGERTTAIDVPFLDKVAAGNGLVRDLDQQRLGVPLVAAGHTMGVLAVAGKDPDLFGEHAANLLATVAAQASLALQNSRLIEILSIGKDEWEQVVDAIRPSIAIIDEHGKVRRANRAFAELVGAPVTTMPGRPWLSLLPASWADVVGRALAGPGTDLTEMRAHQRIFSVRAYKAGDTSAVLVIEDVTETRRLQEQLIQSEKLSAVGQLIAGVAHELNNPLASVLGFADFLGESGQTPPGLIEPVRVIQHEAQRAAGIVKNLLTFARRQDQERQSLDVGPVIKRTIALLNNQLIGLKVEPKLWLDPDLPAVHGSPNQLQQVFLNLINNAAQAISTAGIGSKVTVRGRKWMGGVAIDVEDDGPGIPGDQQDRVFEPFFTTKSAGEGTGLGLSICQGIIKEHGGRITVKSSPGHGAIFTVELPGARPVEPAATARAAQSGSKGKVLVVDDEPHILHYMRATLEAWGHTVETASDGSEGLKRALEGDFDVIISDVRMPRLGGREFFEKLRSERPEMARRVVFATGDTVRDDTQAFLEGSGRPFLHKPFKLAELRSTLSAALGASS